MSDSLSRYWFSLTFLLVGLGYVVLTPPFDAPDETNHFLKAWSVSEGHLLLAPSHDHRLGDTLPQSVGELCQYFRPNGHAPADPVGWQDIRTMLQLSLNQEDRVFTDFANTGMYAPFAYLPGAGVILVMRWLEAPPLYALYAVRLLHLLAWLWVLLAIGRMAGQRRWLFLYAGLLPGILVFQSSANPDALTHAAIWWILAKVLLGDQSSRPSLSEGVLLFLSSVQKLIFVPLGLLFCRSVGWKAAAGWSALALAGALAWGNWASGTFIPYDQYHPQYRDGQTLNPGVDPSAQRQYVFEHPINFMTAMVTGFLRSTPATIAHLVGKYGWDKHYLPGWVMGLLLIGLFLVMISTPIELSPGQRITYLAIACAIILLFSLTNYLLWEPVGQDRMDNFQGRYFIGVVPLVVFAGSHRLTHWPSCRIVSQILLIAGHLCMILFLFQQMFHPV